MAFETSTDENLPLKWSAQYTLVHGRHSERLQGDKIVLPPSALEQLLSAATVTTRNDPNAVSPVVFGYRGHGNNPIVERSQNLPHPLMFRLVNPQNGNIAYAGIREFSAEEGEVEISSFLREALGFKDDQDDPATPSTTALTVHAQRLPKGTFVRFRPFEAGYDPEDWKALLEKYMRNTFTTLTQGEVLAIPNGKEYYRFLIDEIKPEGEGICIVDTDLEVAIEPMNEEQALETLKRRAAKSQNAGKNLSGGTIAVGALSEGRVFPTDYVDCTIMDWDRTKALEIEVQTDDPTEVDVYVTPCSSRQTAKPRVDAHLFEDISERPSKRICIQPSNVEVEGAEAIMIAISGYDGSEQPSPNGSAYTLSVRYTSTVMSNGANDSDKEEPLNLGDVRCKNCSQWVPGGRMFLHENFCLRNNIRCSKCQQVFQKTSDAWKSHWHCEHDEDYGNNPLSHLKHDRLLHVPVTCTACGEGSFNMMALARHRVTVCPDKEILCQFCHLLVPQKGPDDPEFTEPEVMLSGLTPHELSEGARTTECDLCSRIIRLRDMTTHRKHHDLERLSRPMPRLCRNINCGRTLDGVGPNGQIKPPQPTKNDLGLCDTCFGPLYNSAYDPEHKALRRRVERRYLTQLVTGCGHAYCRNAFCKNGRFQAGIAEPGTSLSSKDALLMTKPELDVLLDVDKPLHLCTDEASQKRRMVAEMVAAEHGPDEMGKGYSLPWCIAALEAEGGDLERARTWLQNWAPKRAEK